jgi:hypothetical protein
MPKYPSVFEIGKTKKERDIFAIEEKHKHKQHNKKGLLTEGHLFSQITRRKRKSKNRREIKDGRIQKRQQTKEK